MSEILTTKPELDEQNPLAIQELVFEKLGIFSDEDRKRFINSDSIKMLRPDIEDLLNQKIEEAEIITRLAEKYENWDKEK